MKTISNFCYLKSDYGAEILISTGVPDPLEFWATPKDGSQLFWAALRDRSLLFLATLGDGNLLLWATLGDTSPLFWAPGLSRYREGSLHAET